jgi:glycosyltransferase involved in cell wall biosynthesis
VLGSILGVLKHPVPAALRPRLGRFEPQYAPRPLSVPRGYLEERPPAAPPAISIVTPSLNQGRFIRATLASVAVQGYPNLEYIVADGGSADGTLEALADYEDLIDRLEHGPDGGHIAAINRELGRSQGEILAWLNSDDLLLPGALACVGRYFAEHPEVDLVYGYRVLIDEFGDDVGIWTMPAHSPDALRWVDLVPQETAFWRRRLWDRLGGLREEHEIVFDWDFFRRAEASGARIVRLPRFLGAQRQHGQQKTRTGEGRSLAEQIELRRRDEGRGISRDEIRGHLLSYLARSLPSQYAHRVRGRLALGMSAVRFPEPPRPRPASGAESPTPDDPVATPGPGRARVRT